MWRPCWRGWGVHLPLAVAASVPPESCGLGAGQALFPEVWVPIMGNRGMGTWLPGTMDDGFLIPVVVVQLLSCVQLCDPPWTAACQVSLSFTISSHL